MSFLHEKTELGIVEQDLSFLNKKDPFFKGLKHDLELLACLISYREHSDYFTHFAELFEIYVSKSPKHVDGEEV